MALDSNDRLFARALSRDVDPNKGNYINTVWEGDPFLYRPTKVVTVSYTQTGQLKHYEIYGVPVALRDDWRERLVAERTVAILDGRDPGLKDFLARAKNDPDFRIKNLRDENDPFAYQPTRVIKRSSMFQSSYEILARPTVILRHWQDALDQEQRDSGAKHSSGGSKAQNEKAKASSGTGSGQRRQQGQQRQTPRPRQTVTITVHCQTLCLASWPASRAEVKSAYRALVRSVHPDVNSAPNAAAHFIRVKAAYEALYPLAV